MAYLGLGHLCDEPRLGRREKHARPPGPPQPTWAARTCRSGRPPTLGLPALPQHRHFNYDEWATAGLDKAFVEDYLGSSADSYNHPNAAIEPRIPASSSTTRSPRTNWPRALPASMPALRKPQTPSRRPEKDHRPDRPRPADRPLQGVAGNVTLTGCAMTARPVNPIGCASIAHLLFHEPGDRERRRPPPHRHQ